MKREKYADMYSVIMDLDFEQIELEQVENTLQVFREFLESEVEYMVKHEEECIGASAVFVARYPMIESMLCVILRRLGEINKSMQHTIEAGLNIYKGVSQNEDQHIISPR